MSIANTGYENNQIVVIDPDGLDGLVLMIKAMVGFQFRFTFRNGERVDGEVTDMPGDYEDEIVIEVLNDGLPLEPDPVFRRILLRDVKEIYYY